MSTVQASSYDYAVAVTKSDTADDPAGPFTGLYVSASGTLVCDNYGGPQGSNPITVAVVAGGYICWPVKRVRTTTNATVFGLVSPVVKQGA
jgi:hypothetical protein